MTSYLYELPTTGSLSYTDYCIDNTGSYANDISDATQARANLRAALKESKHSEGEKDFLSLVKVVDNYLPYLYAIKACFDSEEINLSSVPVFSWRSTLSSHMIQSSPRLSVESLHGDLSFTLLTYAFVLSNLARTVVHSLGSYETERTISDNERKVKDEKLNFAVSLLCRASGIFKFISDQVLPEWDRAKVDIPSTSPIHRPIDVTQDMVNALAKMSLADAQTLAIRKLLSKSAYDSTLSPGPPLPKSHPSPALLAKLYLECHALYSSAYALVSTVGKKGLKSGFNIGVAKLGKEKTGNTDNNATDEVSSTLRNYLSDATHFSIALAHKWLGVDAGESGTPSKAGVAIGFLQWACAELESLRSSARTVSLDKDKRDRVRASKDTINSELQSATTFLKQYKKMNDTLHFQPIPTRGELQTQVPEGRSAVSQKPFSKIIPKFGPGSNGWKERREIGDEKGIDSPPTDSEGASSIPSPRTRGTSTSQTPSYAGEGSYF